MSRILPQVGMQITAQPNVVDYAAPVASRKDHITQALLGLAGEGLSLYDKHLEAKSAKAEQEAAHKLEAALLRDPSLKTETWDKAMEKDPTLRQEMTEAMAGHRYGDRGLETLKTNWGMMAEKEQAREVAQLRFQNTANQAAEMVKRGDSVSDMMEVLREPSTNFGLEEKTTILNHMGDHMFEKGDRAQLVEMLERTEVKQNITSHKYLEKLIHEMDAASAKAAAKSALAYEHADNMKNGRLSSTAQINAAVEMEQEQSAKLWESINGPMTPQQRAALNNQVRRALHTRDNIPDPESKRTYEWQLDRALITQPDGTKRLNPQLLKNRALYEQMHAEGNAGLFMDKDTIQLYEAVRGQMEMGVPEEQAFLDALHHRKTGSRPMQLSMDTMTLINKKFKDATNGRLVSPAFLRSVQTFALTMPEDLAFKAAERSFKITHEEVEGAWFPKGMNMTAHKQEYILQSMVKEYDLDASEDYALLPDPQGQAGMVMLTYKDGTPVYDKTDNIMFFNPLSEEFMHHYNKGMVEDQSKGWKRFIPDIKPALTPNSQFNNSQ